ncbi:alpha/beta hydrolase fold protein [Colletotrichum graminicola]|uniref:Alpha/beta hydrolase fold protein n=1 Tax=Colletotrichum graminicola (strain M1.001 / M2 / FGSC 10212) TaxID=645133 RepID=E3QPI1_COLGM|nr:alpha/beta hydrolase fold protein [Colletotrichum graminicola M1.001]EFQ32769.1 alpha/beta hydrolase fold protein [Colletotrichum graminicola M1.001]WDK18005.1 alpha/beta hydrolase fold protein [Colletotrichum graminicola]
MGGITDQIISTQLSHHSQRTNPLAVVATRLSLLGQVPEGYAKACSALAQFDGSLDLEALTTDTAIITGKDDPVSPPKLAEEYALRISNSHYTVLENVGHWHVFEDAEGVAKSLRNFL